MPISEVDSSRSLPKKLNSLVERRFLDFVTDASYTEMKEH